MTDPTLCTAKKTCAGMKFARDRPERRDRTGLDFASALDLKAGKCFPLGYMYRRTSKDNGILLNWCPFCGADFRKLWPRKSASPSGNREGGT